MFTVAQTNTGVPTTPDKYLKSSEGNDDDEYDDDATKAIAAKWLAMSEIQKQARSAGIAQRPGHDIFTDELWRRGFHPCINPSTEWHLWR